MLEYFLVYNLRDRKIIYISTEDVTHLIDHDDNVICIKVTFADYVALKNIIKNELYGLEELAK